LICIIILIAELLIYVIYSILGGNKKLNLFVLSLLPSAFLLYISYRTNSSLFIYIIICIIVISVCALSQNISFRQFIAKRYNEVMAANIKNRVKRSAVKLAVIFYVIGLFGFPIYKIFIEKKPHIDSFLDLWVIFLSFLLLLVSWWFLFTPVCWIIASFFILKGDDVKDIRIGCGYPFLFILALVACGTIYERCNKESNPKPNAHGLYAPQQATKENKNNINKGVYICTGPQSKRYHRSRYCRGLESCSDDIELVDVSEAKDKGRTPCGICY